MGTTDNTAADHAEKAAAAAAEAATAVRSARRDAVAAVRAARTGDRETAAKLAERCAGWAGAARAAHNDAERAAGHALRTVQAEGIAGTYAPSFVDGLTVDTIKATAKAAAAHSEAQLQALAARAAVDALRGGTV